MDFDGTLAPIRKTPAVAFMPASTAVLLRQLTTCRKIVAGIVTGRALSDIVPKVGRGGFFIIANHGFEIFFDNTVWIHPRVERVVPLLTKVASRLRRSLRHTEGILLENKRYTLAVHYRGARELRLRDLSATVKQSLSPYHDQLRLTHGKKVIEIRPDIDWDKGSAVTSFLSLLKKRRHSCIIYLGDDRTDEDAFVALRDRGITIVAGKKRKTAAQYWVKNPGEVAEFLALMATVLSERRMLR